VAHFEIFILENISLAAKLHSMNVEANFTMNPCNSISERKGKSRKALPRHAGMCYSSITHRNSYHLSIICSMAYSVS